VKYAWPRRALWQTGVVILWALTEGSPSSGADENGEVTAFLKKSLGSPADVEGFVGRTTVLRERSGRTNTEARIASGTTSFYRGARSGRNFFFCRLSGTNNAGELADGPHISGRSGSKSYHFNPNTVIYTHKEPENVKDPLKYSTRGIYAFLCQFLNFGLADIKPEAVVWNGNDLTGEQSDGTPFVGELQISNGLPASLKISRSKSEPPYKACAYIYPDPPSSLGGFPSRIVLSVLFDGKLQPWKEFSLIDVKVPKQRLGENFFDEQQFRSTNIAFVHFYTNGVLYELRKDGTSRKVYE
jgi:hypothetical protein